MCVKQRSCRRKKNTLYMYKKKYLTAGNLHKSTYPLLQLKEIKKHATELECTGVRKLVANISSYYFYTNNGDTFSKFYQILAKFCTFPSTYYLECLGRSKIVFF